MNIVKTEGLTKVYGKGDTAVTALDHVALSVETGEFVAVMGPSGCGKATLLHLVGGLERAFASSMGMLYILMTLLALPSLLALVNTLAINVIERTREIGVIRAVLMATHAPRIAAHADRIIFLKDGAIIDETKLKGNGADEAKRVREKMEAI